MRILNLGSLNIDKVYYLTDFVNPEETVKTMRYKEFSGGKGLNQSIALAKAGGEVAHAGSIGKDGLKLKEDLESANVNTENIFVNDNVSGHAVIQVDEQGQNCIIIYGGANDNIEEDYIKKVIDLYSNGDFLLLQNEISNVGFAIEYGKQKGLKIVLNPSPYDERINSFDLNLVDLFLLNKIEARQLANEDSDNVKLIMKKLIELYPTAAFVMTLGSKGAYYFDKELEIFQPSFKVTTLDTTGAGDTFTGYFLSMLSKGHTIAESLEYASVASSIAVGRYGASSSIPVLGEVTKLLNSYRDTINDN